MFHSQNGVLFFVDMKLMKLTMFRFFPGQMDPCPYLPETGDEYSIVKVPLQKKSRFCHYQSFRWAVPINVPIKISMPSSRQTKQFHLFSGKTFPDGSTLDYSNYNI